MKQDKLWRRSGTCVLSDNPPFARPGEIAVIEREGSVVDAWSLETDLPREFLITAKAARLPSGRGKILEVSKNQGTPGGLPRGFHSIKKSMTTMIHAKNHCSSCSCVCLAGAFLPSTLPKAGYLLDMGKR